MKFSSCVIFLTFSVLLMGGVDALRKPKYPKPEVQQAPYASPEREVYLTLRLMEKYQTLMLNFPEETLNTAEFVADNGFQTPQAVRVKAGALQIDSFGVATVDPDVTVDITMTQILTNLLAIFESDFSIKVENGGIGAMWGCTDACPYGSAGSMYHQILPYFYFGVELDSQIRDGAIVNYHGVKGGVEVHGVDQTFALSHQQVQVQGATPFSPGPYSPGFTIFDQGNCVIFYRKVCDTCAPFGWKMTDILVNSEVAENSNAPRPYFHNDNNAPVVGGVSFENGGAYNLFGAINAPSGPTPQDMFELPFDESFGRGWMECGSTPGLCNVKDSVLARIDLLVTKFNVAFKNHQWGDVRSCFHEQASSNMNSRGFTFGRVDAARDYYITTSASFVDDCRYDFDAFRATSSHAFNGGPQPDWATIVNGTGDFERIGFMYPCEDAEPTWADSDIVLRYTATNQDAENANNFRYHGDYIMARFDQVLCSAVSGTDRDRCHVKTGTIEFALVKNEWLIKRIFALERGVNGLGTARAFTDVISCANANQGGVAHFFPTNEPTGYAAEMLAQGFTSDVARCTGPVPETRSLVDICPCKDEWTSWGGDAQNTRHNECSAMTTQNLQDLREACTAEYYDGLLPTVSLNANTNAAPLIIGDLMVYASRGDNVGVVRLPSVASGTFVPCEVVWTKTTKSLHGIPESSTASIMYRTTPAVYTDKASKRKKLIWVGGPNAVAQLFGVFGGIGGLTDDLTGPYKAVSVDLLTGVVGFRTMLTDPANADDKHASAVSSPSVHQNIAFLGMSSLTNAFEKGQFPFYPENTNGTLDMTTRGKVIAIDLDTGIELWRTWMIPKRPTGFVGTWYSGGGVWGSGMSYLPNAGTDGAGLLFTGTGQAYNVTEYTANCLSGAAPSPFVINNAGPGQNETFTFPLRGQTGGGAQFCYSETEAYIASEYASAGDGVPTPLAIDSIVAINVADGTIAWHKPTAGMDAWGPGCTQVNGEAGGVGAYVGGTCGPDWDVGGSAPIVADVDGVFKLVSHNKGGSLFVLDALTGDVEQHIDLCIGAATGGIHWGPSYDPSTGTILASCAGGLDAPSFGFDVDFRETVASGDEICQSGHGNAIDIRTGDLLWQVIPGRAKQNTACDTLPFELPYTDIRFKEGLTFGGVVTRVHKNVVDLSVPVVTMPVSTGSPLTDPESSRMHGTPSSIPGTAFFTVYEGTTYAVDIANGQYKMDYNCPEGALYGGAVVANGRVAFGCGYNFFEGNAGKGGRNIAVYSLPAP